MELAFGGDAQSDILSMHLPHFLLTTHQQHQPVTVAYKSEVLTPEVTLFSPPVLTECAAALQAPLSAESAPGEAGGAGLAGCPVPSGVQCPPGSAEGKVAEGVWTPAQDTQ